jgi:hypothetical protein
LILPSRRDSREHIDARSRELGLAAAPCPQGLKERRIALVIFLAAMRTKGKVVKQQVGDLSGAAPVRRITNEMADEGLEPTVTEAELLTLAQDLQDRLVELEQAIASEGLTRTSKSGAAWLRPGRRVRR